MVDKFILQLEAQLSDRNVTIELTDEAREWLVKNGYDESMGARPMARVIQTQIKTPLADEVLFGRLKGGGVVKVVVIADEAGTKKLSFVYPEGPGPTPARARSDRRGGRAALAQAGRSRPAPRLATRSRRRKNRKTRAVLSSRGKGSPRFFERGLVAFRALWRRRSDRPRIYGRGP